MFEEMSAIRSEIDVLSNTIVMGEQVRGLLHYQRVQQAMSFANAVLACIPFAGGVAGHVLSGGMAILENANAEDFRCQRLG